MNNDGTMVQTASPGFVNLASQDFHLASGSACINAGDNLNPAVLPTRDVVRQYLKHQSNQARPNDGLFDIGAFEFVF